MKLGFVSPCKQDMIDFAAESGFDCLEFLGGHGFDFDATRFTAQGIADLKAALAAKGLYATSAIQAVNPLSADPAEAARDRDYLNALIELCPQLGIRAITGTTGQNVDLSLDDNIRLFGKVYGELAEKASAAGVTIAFENCPHGYPRGANLAVTPELWGRLFREVPSPALGLEYDPSHLVWQDVDYVQGVLDFGDRIRLVHAKDTEIISSVKARVGFYGHGWWRYRLPGYGQVNWARFFQALREIGYDGEVIIEHEDPVFEGERLREGLILGKHFLDTFIF